MNKPEPRLNVPRRALAAVAAWMLGPVAAHGQPTGGPPTSTGQKAVTPAAPSTVQAGRGHTVELGPNGLAPRIAVTASKDQPHVQSTFPVQGARIAPGLLVLRVTYDVHMRPDGWAYAEGSAPTAYPDCAKAPRLLDDKRSFVLVCRTLPNKSYAVWFNRPPLVDFASMSRRAAAPYQLKFATTDDDPVRTLADAVKADPALKGQGEPVQAPGQARFGQDDAPTPY